MRGRTLVFSAAAADTGANEVDMLTVTRVAILTVIPWVLTACPHGGRRPLGSDCESDDGCASGFCGGGVCLVPTSDDDHDGLTNELEVRLGSSPLSPDTDGDGETDDRELDASLANRDTDGDGKPDVVESASADADGDCITDQYDADDSVPSQDPSPMIAVVCAQLGLCRSHQTDLAVSCASGDAICVYDGVAGYASPEATCDGVDEDCSGTPDDAFPDRDGDDIADCVDDDWDNDGVADAVDHCPTVADANDPDRDGDGIGDACAADYTFALTVPSGVLVGVPFAVDVALARTADTEGAPFPAFSGTAVLSLENPGPVGLAGPLAVPFHGNASGATAHVAGLVVTRAGSDLVLSARAGELGLGRSAAFDAVEDGVHCAIADNCASKVCGVGGECAAARCDDGVLNGSETAEGCGGDVCDPCTTGDTCTRAQDCTSGVCDETEHCTAPACDDRVANGEESGVDCGGTSTCGVCGEGGGCALAGDCASGVCGPGRVCLAPACDDRVANGGESGVDCGGTSTCKRCGEGLPCGGGRDCDSGVCAPAGVCAPPDCEDGAHNGLESGVDCGGTSLCERCDAGLGCSAPSDCASGVCGVADMCLEATCDDRVQNGGESGVDCGGATLCRRCGVGDACTRAEDCEDGQSCGANGTCVAPPHCTSGVVDGDESDVDCGGSECDTCAAGMRCATDADCNRGTCTTIGRCQGEVFALQSAEVASYVSASTRPFAVDGDGVTHVVYEDTLDIVDMQLTGSHADRVVVTTRTGSSGWGSAQLKVAADARGRVVLWYDDDVSQGRDDMRPYVAIYTPGTGWSAPQNLVTLGLLARDNVEFHQGYDMALDSAGRMHTVVCYYPYFGYGSVDYQRWDTNVDGALTVGLAPKQLREGWSGRCVVFVDTDDVVHVTFDRYYVDQPLHYLRSVDGGQSWSDEVPTTAANGPVTFTSYDDQARGLVVTGSGADKKVLLSHRGAGGALEILERSEDGSWRVFFSANDGADHHAAQLRLHYPIAGGAADALEVFAIVTPAATTLARLERARLDLTGRPEMPLTRYDGASTLGLVSFGLPGATWPASQRLVTAPVAFEVWLLGSVPPFGYIGVYDTL